MQNKQFSPCETFSAQKFVTFEVFCSINFVLFVGLDWFEFLCAQEFFRKNKNKKETD